MKDNRPQSLGIWVIGLLLVVGVFTLTSMVVKYEPRCGGDCPPPNITKTVATKTASPTTPSPTATPTDTQAATASPTIEVPTETATMYTPTTVIFTETPTSTEIVSTVTTVYITEVPTDTPEPPKTEEPPEEEERPRELLPESGKDRRWALFLNKVGSNVVMVVIFFVIVWFISLWRKK